MWAGNYAALSGGWANEVLVWQHMAMRDGRIRDSMLYSIIAPEWPLLKQRLAQRLQPRLTAQHSDRHGGSMCAYAYHHPGRRLRAQHPFAPIIRTCA
jgi:hypothetical protein